MQRLRKQPLMPSPRKQPQVQRRHKQSLMPSQ